MATQRVSPVEPNQPDRRKHDPTLHERKQNGSPKPVPHGVFRSLGLGVITGASDDDPAAIGTYSSAGALLGPSFLWTVPVMAPMMFAVIYLSSKVGQVTGQGLFGVLRQHYARWLVYGALAGVMIGNIIEATADLGGMAASLQLIVPLPVKWIVAFTALTVLALQVWGSYELIRNVFRWLALALLAYFGSAVLAKPAILPVLKGTFIPTIHFDREFFTMIVAVVGTTLSAYLYTWQSNQDVEEDISMGRRRLTDRVGTTTEELRHSARDVGIGVLFSNATMYFVLLSTASTLFVAGKHHIESAAEAAMALQPLAGKAAGLLFAMGVVGVGFLAVPIMTTGAAYSLCQTFGWKHGLHSKPGEAKLFYGSISAFTLIAMCINFIGINPIKALVWSSVVQGFSTPFLMVAVMLITNDKRIMGKWVNGRAMNILGAITTLAIFAAVVGLIVTFFI